jgi:c-di-GMP-binding flagellar brake protein YcgR
METVPERRSCRRIVVGPEHAIRFQAKGRPFQNIRITNISSTGCFAMVGQHEVPWFEQGALLENFAFEHPALTTEPITARVMYVLGGADVLEFVGVGIQFVSMNVDSTRTLDAFLYFALKP